MTQSELAKIMAVLFLAFGRELSEVDVAAWMLCLGDRARDDVAEAALCAARTCESLPSAAGLRRMIAERKMAASRNMPSTTSRNIAIAMRVDEYRQGHPDCTADEVCEFVSQLERKLTKA
jgi:hypothetical protein